MINTITLNPSLDYIVKVDSFKVDFLNRTAEELATKEEVYELLKQF
jgi:fructose-1-phosphate kinase PfkB-like protein